MFLYNLVSFFLSVVVSLSPGYSSKDQANKLLTHVSLDVKAATPLFSETTTINDSGFVWFFINWGRNLYISRISPRGEILLNKLLIAQINEEYPELWLNGPMACDRWGNVYCGYFPRTRDNHTCPLHLIRVTPGGQVKDYYPWPDIRVYNYMEVLPGDTLLVAGFSSDFSKIKVYKGLLDEEGIIPVFEKDFKSGYSSLNEVVYSKAMPQSNTMLDWGRNWGLYIISDSDYNTPVLSETFRIQRLNLNLDTDHSYEDLGLYDWNKYTWRIFHKTWIGNVTITPYKNGGYVLCLVEPMDASTTYMIRLDSTGVPIDPKTLSDGGIRKPIAFDKLPASAKPYVGFGWWESHLERTKRDSAHVTFWGVDSEGNIYNYRKLQKL